MIRRFLWFVFFSGIAILVCAGVGVVWGYNYITRDLPDLNRVESYSPPAVSEVFASDGTLVAEFFYERRYPVKFSEIPKHVQRAFLAAEDASFYQHPGIDLMSIARAAIKNLETGSFKQGGSTITQQVVKNLLLTSERKIDRKLKEAILSYEIEKKLTKDQILELYLNQIFFGNSAYGIKAASRLYFQKELDQLSIAEAAMLAGLPKAPSRYSPLTQFDRAKNRQLYVLKQMVESGFISESEAREARKEELKVFRATQQNIYHAAYYVSEVKRVLAEKWPTLNPERDGLKIYTALDLQAEEFATAALRNGLRDVDKRRGWRGPLAQIPGAKKDEFLNQFGGRVPEKLTAGEIYPALVTAISGTSAMILIGEFDGKVDLRDPVWARRRLDSEDRVSGVELLRSVRIGDVIEVSYHPVKDAKGVEIAGKFVFDQVPEIEGAVVLLNPNSGRVVAIVGGYDYSRSNFNRATQSLRQPGSAFKPIVYLSAVDGFRYSPATIVYDEPREFRVGDEVWTPGNYDETFLGPISLQLALEKSRNLVSADIVSRIGVDAVIRYAKALGITSPLGRNLSLSLGSSEVTLLELTRAYGVFIARGLLIESSLIDRIEDRHGNVIFDLEASQLTRAKQVIDEKSAFVMAHMMRGVVERGTGYKIRELGRPAAGKTGTSNDQMDTWYVGFTPEWACGVWVGFDLKKMIGPKETGGRVAAPIWLQLMQNFLNLEDQRENVNLIEDAKAEAELLKIRYVVPESIEEQDFSVPEGVDPYWIDLKTGVAVSPDTPGAALDYFPKGSEPAANVKRNLSETYLDSPDL